MRELDKPIGRVWRRLRLQRFLAAMVWCLATALAVATGVMAAEKLGQPIPGAAWLPFAIGGGLAVFAAAIIAAFTGPNRTDAAVALDRVFELNERLSTALTLPEILRDTPAGRALVADAVRHVADLDVSERFGLSVPRRAWVPLIPVLIAAALVLVPKWTAESVANAKFADSPKVDKQVVTKNTTALGKKIAEQRKAMDKTKFAEAERLLAEVEKTANELAKSPPAQKDKAMMALNKLTDAVKERQKQLGSPEQVIRQLQQLKDMANNGPAEDFTKALAKGDFEKAANELKQIKEKLASGKMTEKEKEELKKQIGDMAQQLKQLADLDKRKQQLEEAKKNGGLSEEQFQKEMAKVNDQAQKMENLKKMANQLAEAQQQMAKGDTQKAAEALGMSEKQLNKMAQEMAEMGSLEGALADLQQAKDGMNGEGQGEGMNKLGDGFNQLGQNKNRKDSGNGMGKGGIGEGARDEAPDNVATYTTKDKNQYTKGAAIVEGTAPPSTQSKGQSNISIQGEVETASGNSADALVNQKIPKSVEKHIKSYYDQINKGKP